MATVPDKSRSAVSFQAKPLRRYEMQPTPERRQAIIDYVHLLERVDWKARLIDPWRHPALTEAIESLDHWRRAHA